VVSRENAERQLVTAPTLLLTALVVLALALRFYRLGDWSLDSDEVFMLRDSVDPRLTNPRPLLYFLNYWLVRPIMPLDELGLRLLPAIFGALAIPVFYFMARRLIGTRTALFGAFLLTVSPLHVYYSQFARYWSLVFLLSSVYPFAIYIGLRERKTGYLVLGLITAVLAILAHPASVLLVGGLGIWILRTYVKREQMSRLWAQSKVRWGVLLVLVFGGFTAFRLVRLLQGWISDHDTKPGGTEFLLALPSRPGLKQLLYTAGFVESLTFLLVLTALLGLYLLWQRHRSLALLLTSMFLFPMVFLVLLSFRTPVSTFYLLPTVPTLFLGAGFFLDRLSRLEWELRPRWVLAAALALVITAEGAPTLVSQYRDGRRYDFRGAARWLEQRISSDDVVFSDQYKVVTHYLPGKQIRRLLGDPTPLKQSVRVLHNEGGANNAVWVVTPAPSHAFRTNPKLGSLHRWIYDNCQLRTTLGRTRLDFRQNLLQIYRCRPTARGDVSVPERSPISWEQGPPLRRPQYESLQPTMPLPGERGLELESLSGQHLAI
jgi:hypothetical protein